MSNLVVPIVGLRASLQNEIYSWVNATLHLFVSPWTPGSADVLETYLAIEATFPGYAPQIVTGWIPPIQDGGTPPGVITQASPVTWTRLLSGPTQNVWGVFFVDQLGILRWVQVDDNAPVPVTNAGDPYTWVPVFDRRSQ